MCIDCWLLGTKWVWFSFVLTVCSVLSKEQGVTVVAVCVVYDFFTAHKVCGCGCVRACACVCVLECLGGCGECTLKCVKKINYYNDVCTFSRLWRSPYSLCIQIIFCSISTLLQTLTLKRAFLKRSFILGFSTGFLLILRIALTGGALKINVELVY